MRSYEYTVIPAPSRGEKTRGAKAGIERFAATLGDVLNGMARDGWEYVRAEVLPAEERSGLTSRTTVYHNLLIFRRPTATEPLREAVIEAARPAAEPGPAAVPVPAAPIPAAPLPAAAPQPSPAPAAQDPLAAVDLPADAPVRPPFSQPMRPAPRPAPSRNAEPPLSAPELTVPTGPRLGPASR